MYMLRAPELGKRGRVMKSMRVIGWMIALLVLKAPHLAGAQNPDLSADVKYWEDLAKIEKAKSDVETAEAERREAIATAKKAEMEARFPPGATEQLAGSITATESKMGLAANVLAVDLAKQLADNLCAKLEPLYSSSAMPGVVIYNETVFGAMSTSRLLLEQLAWLEANLEKASTDARKRESAAPAPERPLGANRMTRRLLMAGPALIALTGSIRAFADLTSLAKTNVSLSPSKFADGEAQALFVTALQQGCKDRVVSLEGYLGEIPSDTVEVARKRIGTLHTYRDIIVEDRDRLKANLPKLPVEKRAAAQSDIDDLTALVTQADGFLTALAPFESNATSPLMTALKLEALNKRISGHHVMELKFLMEGLSVTRDNMFTGQKLYLSATSIFWYRILDRQGNVQLADVQRRIVTPMFFDVKGKNPKDAFFTPLQDVHGYSPTD